MMNKMHRHTKQSQTDPSLYQHGFSLIEMIVALAIMSIVMSVLFQSVYGWVRLSDRINNASQNSVAGTVKIKQFQYGVSGLIATWPENEDEVFTGTSIYFRGLSRFSLDGATPRLRKIEYRLEVIDEAITLLFQSPENQWPLASFPDVTINSNPAATFSYLGADGQWQEQWPPAENPVPGPFIDATQFPIPQLPLAIRMRAGKEVWIASLPSTPQLPLRAKDVTPG